MTPQNTSVSKQLCQNLILQNIRSNLPRENMLTCLEHNVNSELNYCGRQFVSTLLPPILLASWSLNSSVERVYPTRRRHLFEGMYERGTNLVHEHGLKRMIQVAVLP